MRTYPYTIENGAGEWLTFTRRTSTASGDRIEGENRVAPGAGPPMHVHHLQEEALTVLQGRLGYQREGEPPAYAGPGATVLFRAGEAHRFWNSGDDDLRCTAYVSPVGNLEYFLEAVFASQKSNGGRRPSLFDAAYLTTRYREEFGMREIPGFVQRLLFPLVIALGGALGKYRKYADAPEPIGG